MFKVAAAISIVVSVFGVLALILGLAEFYGGAWTTVAQNLAFVSVMIMFAGVLLLLLKGD